MAIDYITLGGTPADEPCAQLNSDEYYKNMQAETKAYIHQLQRCNGEPPYGSFFKRKAFDHDFGTYHEVVIVYNTDVPEHVQYAQDCEHKLPEKWDDEAQKELAEAGYPFGPLEKASKPKK